MIKQTVLLTDWLEVHNNLGLHCNAKFLLTAKKCYMVLRKQDGTQQQKLFLVDRNLLLVEPHPIPEILESAEEITLFNLSNIDVDSKELSDVIKLV